MTFFIQILFLLLTTAALHSAAQSVDFTKANFADNKEGLREAMKELKDGDTEYAADPPRYAQALPHYLAAQQFNPKNAGLNVKIDDCYLHSASKTAALLYLQKAAKLDVTADARTHFLLARALHMSAEFPEALAEYQQARPVGGNTRNGSADNLTANDLQRYIR